MSGTPFFSIVIPTYNRGSLIADVVQTVLSQDFQDWELIVVDDGSTDDTQDVLKSIDDKRIRYVWQENAERGRARNHGGELARGKYLNFFDSDDKLHRDHLSQARAFISKQGAPTVFWQPYQFTSPEGEVLGQIPQFSGSTNDRLVKHGNAMVPMSVFIQREAFLACPFNEDRNLSGSEDYEHYLRLAARHTILKNWVVTSSLVEHADRSIYNFAPAPLILRFELLIKYLKKDQAFMDAYGEKLPVVQAEAHSYVALHGAMSKEFPISQAFSYWIQSIKEYPLTLFRRRTLGFIKQVTLRIFRSS